MSHRDRLGLSEKTARADRGLADGAVQVWQAHIPDVAAYLDTLHSVLSSEKRERANRFYRQPDMHRFVIGRGVLRYLLSYYLLPGTAATAD